MHDVVTLIEVDGVVQDEGGRNFRKVTFELCDGSIGSFERVMLRMRLRGVQSVEV